MQLIKIDSVKATSHLDSLSRRSGIVALLGSGISIWEPSNIPNGQKITEELAEIIASSTISPRQTVIDLIRRSAFEHIIERYPRYETLRHIVPKYFYPTNPNPLHEAFARLIDKGIIEHIITPNYDVGLEQACSSICRSPRVPEVVVSEDDASKLALSRPVIFKIHGCATPGRERSLVMRLSEEGVLPDWKRHLLSLLINGRDLLVCGYSGLDFEICPELIHVNPLSITWNSYLDPRLEEDALTPNAKRVLVAKDKAATVLIGDMKEILEKLDKAPCEAHYAKSSPSFVPELIATLDEWETSKWRVWVLNGLSCALDGIEIANQMIHLSGTSTKRRVDSLLALAEPLFHRGLYFQAGAAYREAAVLTKSFLPHLGVMVNDLKEAESQTPPDEKLIKDLLERISDYLEKILKAEIGIVESDRVAGYWFRASRRVRQAYQWLPALAPPQLREKIESEIVLKRILLRRYPYYLAKKARLHVISSNIQSKVRRELSLATDHFSRRGSWFNLQHCEMLAKRFDINFADVYTTTMMPLAAHEGYKHLGYILAEMMAYRGRLADPNVLAPPVNYNYISIANEIGIHPETWKLARAIKQRFGNKLLPSSAKKFAKQAWKKCEYTLPMRALLLLRGDDP
jgi:hypothetical protein